MEEEPVPERQKFNFGESPTPAVQSGPAHTLEVEAIAVISAFGKGTASVVPTAQ